MNTRAFRVVWQRFGSWWRETFYNYAGSEAGFLRLALMIRIAIFFLLTAGFGFFYRASAAPVVPARLAIWALLGYFTLVVFLAASAVFRPAYFESGRAILLQVFVDVLVVAFFYYTSGDPQ